MPFFHNTSSPLFQAIFSTSWENINQSFYTRLAQSIDPIDSTITFFGEVLSSGILKSVNSKGEDVTESDDLIKLLRNPNSNQNFSQFIEEWLYYHYSHGWNYIVPQNRSVGFETKLNSGTQLFNCDPDYIDWNSLYSFVFNFFSKNEDLHFSYRPLGFTRIKYSNVIPYFDVRQNPEKPYIGISRLLALKQNIQNYALAGQAKENMIKRSGSQIVSLDVKTFDDFGLDGEVGTGEIDKDGNPITTTHKKKLEKELRETGIGNNTYGVAFSTLPLKAFSLSDGLEKLDYDKLSVEDARVIINKYNLPKEFQNLTTESAKFANRQMAMIEVIQNTIEPLAQYFCEKISSFFKWENTIYIDYSHLPVFAENEKTKIETMKIKLEVLFSMFEKGLIDESKLKEKIQGYEEYI
ncbi:phage portal protein [Epilithonimonas caeni]|uniref:phage portal protein n=1 Tax=Epilithonimonas caeni TaxID=365343 RepID=UPI00041ED462|nr:phage portal protein [Epilithonimonas caeni]